MRKVVLITGSSSGIGRSTAIVFAKNDYNVVITYNNSEKEAYKLESELKEKYNTNSLVIKLDICDENSIKNCVEKTIEKFGKIDVLVNSAGIAIDTIYEDKNKYNFMKLLEVNTVGTFLMCKYVSPYMLKEKKGNIVNISSTNGMETTYIESLDYDASKAGIISLTHNFARSLAPYVTVNCICPGWVKTPMNKDLSIEQIEEEKRKILLGRFADVEDISNVIMFLASSKANYINDAIIRVDGGKYNN